MGFRLQSHISFCQTAGRTIILDLRRDWYFQLQPDLADSLVSGGEPSPDDPTMQRLVELGIIVEAPEQTTDLRPTRAAAVIASCFDDQARLSRGYVSAAEVWWSIDQARRRLRKGPLVDVIADVRVRKSARDPVRPDKAGRLQALACNFNRKRRDAAVEPICLQDSLALLDVLARRGLYPELVIGVTAAPFLAHAWVQTGGLILNDALDEVRAYQPILVV